MNESNSMALAICKCEEFTGGREIGDRSHPLTYVCLVGCWPSKGVPWSHLAVPCVTRAQSKRRRLALGDGCGWTTIGWGPASSTCNRCWERSDSRIGVLMPSLYPRAMGADERDMFLKPHTSRKCKIWQEELCVKKKKR